MKISKKLNLVIPMELDDGGTYYAHSTPLSREAFEKYYKLIARTFSAMYEDGMSTIAGPRVAALMLRSAAEELQLDEGIVAELLNEVRRLTNVMLPSEEGWQAIPFQAAVNRGMIDDDAAAELEGQIVFFICNSAMHTKERLKVILHGLTLLWGSQITLQNSTEYLRSLQTSIEDESTGETPIT